MGYRNSEKEGTTWDGVAGRELMPNGESGPSLSFLSFQMFGP